MSSNRPFCRHQWTVRMVRDELALTLAWVAVLVPVCTGPGNRFDGGHRWVWTLRSSVPRRRRRSNSRTHSKPTDSVIFSQLLSCASHYWNAPGYEGALLYCSTLPISPDGQPPLSLQSHSGCRWVCLPFPRRFVAVCDFCAGLWGCCDCFERCTVSLVWLEAGRPQRTLCTVRVSVRVTRSASETVCSS